MDKVFYPDRTRTETAAFCREGQIFFETTVRRKLIDRVLCPDLDAEEALDIYEEGQVFFESVMRRK